MTYVMFNMKEINPVSPEHGVLASFLINVFCHVLKDRGFLGLALRLNRKSCCWPWTRLETERLGMCIGGFHGKNHVGTCWENSRQMMVSWEKNIGK